MIFPLKGNIKDLTSTYYGFGQAPYSIGGYPVANPDGSVFGFRHHGIDCGPIPLRTPIYAPEDGVVSFSGNAGTAGNLVQIDGETGRNRMLHNDSNVVKTGQRVEKGQLIGFAGMTGYSNGFVHVHWDLTRGGKYVNPMPYIKEEEDDMYLGRTAKYWHTKAYYKIKPKPISWHTRASYWQNKAHYKQEPETITWQDRAKYWEDKYNELKKG